LSAVVDLPTPPCRRPPQSPRQSWNFRLFDIGDAGLCGGDATDGRHPLGCRCGGGDAGAGLRSAVSAIMATVTREWRTAASACAARFPRRELGGVDIDRKEHLAVSTVMADSTFALVKATPRGDATWTAYREPVAALRSRRISWLCSDATIDGPTQRLPAPNVIHALDGPDVPPCSLAAS